jgi:hypothetical protein
MKASFTRVKKTTKRAEKHVKGAMQELLFPSVNYYLDESDADIAILRRQEDDSFVAAFSARGATKQGRHQGGRHRGRRGRL